MSGASVFELDTMIDTINRLTVINHDISDLCDEGLKKADSVLGHCQKELDISECMLKAAQVEEAIKLAEQIQADARMARALAQEAAAISSMNPVAIAAASAEVAAAGAELARVTEEYQKAVEHRKQLEHRCELAKKCVDIAQEMLDTLNLRFNYSRNKLNETISRGNGRLKNAYEDLKKYLSRLSLINLRDISDFMTYKPKEKEPVTPKDIHDRLHASKSVVNAILEYLYCTDLKFRGAVDRLCLQLQSPENVSSVEVKIKKNIVGRLCEELVIRCFSPMGEKVETQAVFYLEDGRYTKADMILYGLKEPLILGRGSGMGAQKGGNLGIEVKSGSKEYIYAQLKHMERQAKGHSQCDLSCTVCSRDITDLSPEKEELLRNKLREAGSPLMGMLPYKEELDAECINFVKEKAEDQNV